MKQVYTPRKNCCGILHGKESRGTEIAASDLMSRQEAGGSKSYYRCFSSELPLPLTAAIVCHVDLNGWILA